MEPFLGQIMMVGFTFNPRGWANCDGQLLPISQNTALFSLLGTTYGGDGRTTFALPDLRGRVPVHTGTGGSLTNRPQGQRSGTETNTITVGQLPAHGHPITLQAQTTGDTDDPNNGVIAGNGLNSFGTAPDTTLTAGTGGNTGNGQAVNNMQPYNTVRFIIALQGIFPSRS